MIAAWAAPWAKPGPAHDLLTLLGPEAWVVGGAVRNALLGLPVADIDICTALLPEVVTARAQAAGLGVVPTGLAHGTVTVVVAGQAFEVTTLRRDVATDGRHAIVAFTGDLAEDAGRRDLTLNALYATVTGQLIDPLGGLPDLLARRVRFVGDPAARIAEDHLRILRFFRFHAWYGDPAGGIDAEALAAAAAAVDRIAAVSRERVGAEMRKLLAAPDPAPSLAAMQASGVLAAVLPGAEAAGVAPLVDAELQLALAPDWLCRLAALTPGGADTDAALRLSRAEAAALAAIRAALDQPEPPEVRAERHGAAAARAALLIEAVAGLHPPADWAAAITRGAAARFPVSAADLMPPLSPGPTLGAALARLREDWRASCLTLTREDLLRRL